MYCKNCGKQIDDKAVVCIHCGVSTSESQQPVINIVNTNTNFNGHVNAYSPKKKITALWLCILLGYFGAHRFYVGKTGSAIIYLFTGGIFGIGIIIDFISIICGNFRDKAGLLLS